MRKDGVTAGHSVGHATASSVPSPEQGTPGSLRRSEIKVQLREVFLRLPRPPGASDAPSVRGRAGAVRGRTADRQCEDLPAAAGNGTAETRNLRLIIKAGGLGADPEGRPDSVHLCV